MIHIYYGNGKGKTTAAIGLGMRAKGAGMSVCLVQFFKNNNSSELSALPFDIYEAPASLPFAPDESYQKWINGAIDYVKNSKADVIILDEFIDLIPKFITADDAVTLLDSNKEYIITGHKEVTKLFEVADYITNMQKEKHPYDNGVQARKGIEY